MHGEEAERSVAGVSLEGCAPAHALGERGGEHQQGLAGDLEWELVDESYSHDCEGVQTPVALAS